MSRRFRAPLQVLEPLDLAGDGSAWAVLLNPAGGILGGDTLRTEIEVGPGAQVGVTTPSATKVYRCPGLPAAQHTSIRVGEDATLEYRPHHLIPHAGAAFEQTLHVELQARSRLILYDGLALGRVARGERWAFRSLSNEIRVTDARGPLFGERLRLLPGHAPALGGIAGAEEHAYVGTLLVCDPGRGEWREVAEALADLVAGQGDVRGGVSLLGRSGCVVRLLSRSAHAMAYCAGEAWLLARRHVLRRPPVDLRLG